MTDGYTNSVAARVARTPVLLIGELCGWLRLRSGDAWNLRAQVLSFESFVLSMAVSFVDGLWHVEVDENRDPITEHVQPGSLCRPCQTKMTVGFGLLCWYVVFWYASRQEAICC